MKFKKSKKAREEFFNKILSVEDKLSDLDAETSMEFINWIDKKAGYFKQSIERANYSPQPDDLKRGDLIWVEFGINIGSELSDYLTKGHYGVVWSIDLGNIVVIPIISRAVQGSNMTYDIGIIEELNESCSNQHSYLKLDAIRSVSKRRISRMPAYKNGKIILKDEVVEKIRKIIYDNFIEDGISSKSNNTDI